MIDKNWDVDAKPVYKVAALYPHRAQSRGVCGWVAVIASISETGMLTDASVCESSPPGVFDEAVLKAVRAQKYTPASRGGLPVASELVIRQRFETGDCGTR